MGAGQIVEVDPSTLTIALNVRADAKLDKEFVASIKELGVLQPPMVTAAEGGGYDVVLGQRRTLAAVEAGLKSIPVYLVDKHEAEAARVIDQLTENEQRQSLSEVDRMRGYKELSLFGISPAQIAKRTATPRGQVDAALAVADSDVATAALEQFEITLDQAAVIVEFADDAAAVEKLRGTAESDPRQFEHVVADLRKKREHAAERARLEAEFAAAGVTVLKYSTYRHEYAAGFVNVAKFGKPGAPEEPASADDVADKALLGARALQDWVNGGYVIVPQYFVADGGEHGLPKREYANGLGSAVAETKEEKAARLADEAKRKQEQQEREARIAAANAAREVRSAWLKTDLLQRAKLPDYTALLAVQLTWNGINTYDENIDEDTLALAGIPEVADGADEIDLGEYVREHLAARPTLVPRWILAALIESCEGDMNSYRAPESTWAKTYLEQLEAWGYGLSDYERALTVIQDAEGEAA